MNAIRTLEQHHRDILALFDQLGVPAPEAAVHHPVSRHETTHDAEARFRDEGGASAMDRSASEYHEETRSFDRDSETPAEAVLTGRAADPHLDDLGSLAAGLGEAVAVAPPFDQDERRRQFDALAEAILAHTTVEEQVFYPAARSEQTEDLVYEALEDHKSVRRLVDELRHLLLDARTFEQRLALLREKLTNHFDDEEGELYPNIAALLREERLKELGAQIDEKYRTLRGYLRQFEGRGGSPVFAPAPGSHVGPRAEESGGEVAPVDDRGPDGSDEPRRDR